MMIAKISDYLFVAARFVNKSLGVPERDVVIPKE
jgi:cob(I)alamin adenosyltransferase